MAATIDPGLVISGGVLIKYEGDGQDVTIPDSVTSIGDEAFRDCRSLASVTIPDSVTSIGDSAFSGCKSLASVTIPDSVTSIGDEVFQNCSSLASVTIPDSVTAISYRAFRNCTSLVSITIPDSVTSIGSSAFWDCDSLDSITIPDSVTSIGSSAFWGCRLLTSIKIPDSVNNIGAQAFSDCHSLASITIPDSVTAIGSGTFSHCRSLASVTIPDSVASISNGAFLECSALVSVTIPDSVPSIAEWTFSDCTSLASVMIPDSVTSIGEGAFERCRSLASVMIPDSVNSIGASAFRGCTSLVSITIPDSVTSIGEGAFAGCTSLASVTIPDSVTSIGDGAFMGCTSLASVMIPDSVTSIGVQAFEDGISAQSVRSDEQPKKDRIAPQQTPKKSKKDSVTPYAAELKALAAHDEDARQQAARTLFDAHQDALPALLEGLSARSQECRKWCALLLKEHARHGKPFVRDSEVVDALAARLADPNWETRRYRAAALGYIGSPDALVHLREARDSEDEITSAAALAGLYAAGDEEAHTRLLGMVADSSADGRWAAVVSLDLASKPGVDLDVLKSALSDRSKYVRQAAEMAISNLESQGEQPDFVIVDGVLVGYEGDGQDVTIPDSVISIGDEAFKQCSSLVSVTVPDSVTFIGDDAFWGCDSLISVTIPDSVTEIGHGAFWGCDSLISITIPDSVTEIGDGAFMDCRSLVSVTIPDSVSDMGMQVFMDCRSLVSVTIPGSVTSIGYQVFAGCTSLVSITIPDSVTEIGDGAFAGCTSLVSITIPDSVTFIGEGVFEGCSSLSSRGVEMDVGGFLAACASGDIETVRRLAQDLDSESGRDVLGQGITVATMSGATEVFEFLQPIADVLESDSGPRDDSSLHAPDAQSARSAEEPKKDRNAPQRAPKKSKKESATPYAAELKALASHDEDARQQAAQALADAGEAALPALLEGLSARSRDCRKWCAYLLKEHARYGGSFVRDPQVVEALAARLDDPDWETRRYRAAALGYIGIPEALRHLREVRDSEDEVTRAAALAGLYAAGDEDAHAQLLEMVADASADGRWAAVLSLDLASKPGVDLDVLKSALSDRSKYVREAAESAISNLEASGTGESETASQSSTTAATATSSDRSASEVLAELVNSVSGSWATYPKPDERARLIQEFAAHGTGAIDALERMSDMLSAPDVTTMPNEDQMRHIQWAVGRIDARGSAKRLLKYGFQTGPEMIIQAVRAVVRSGSSGEVDLVGLEERLGPEVHKERQVTRMLNDVLLAFFLAVEDEGVSSPETSRERATFLLDNLDTAMRWETRIHTEREYGVLTDELDPLYARVESLLRSVKGPYYFRNAADRAARIAEHGHDTDGLVLSSSEVERIGVGDVVTVYLEHEHEMGYYWTEVSVRVVDEPRDTPAGRLFVGQVQSTGDWLGPYVLEKGERVLFLGSHIHGQQD